MGLEVGRFGLTLLEEEKSEGEEGRRMREDASGEGSATISIGSGETASYWLTTPEK